MVQDGQTRRGAIGSLISALAAPHTAAIQPGCNPAANRPASESIFVAADLAAAIAAGESTVDDGAYFKAVSASEAVAEIRVRTAAGSALLYTEVTKAALESTDPDKGAALVKLASGGTVQQAIQWVTPEMFGAVGNGVADDTAAWQVALTFGSVRGQKGAIYYTTAPLGAPLSGATVDLGGSTIIANWEQSTGEYEACIFIDGQDNVTIRDGKIEYTGTFNHGSSYSGLVSGIHANNADYLLIEQMEIAGFNRAGIFVGATVTGSSRYCQNPRVTNTYCHHNRVAGIIFGHTEAGLVQLCHLHFNGDASDYSTGYGFAGWAGGVPKNTHLLGNWANDNYRKGVDFHAGHNGMLVGNTLLRNRVCGIYIDNVTGDWQSTSDSIGEMKWEGRSDFTMFALFVGSQSSAISDPVSFTVTGLTVSNFTAPTGSCNVLYVGGAHQAAGKFKFSGCTFNVGKVTKILEGNVVTPQALSWYDVSFTNNDVTAIEVTSVPFTFRGSNNRKKNFSDNRVEIAAVGATAGVVVYDGTVARGNTLVARGNDLTVPASAWSAGYDPIGVKFTPCEVMSGNIVNGAQWRDWDGSKYIGRGPGSLPPHDGCWWTVGSIWQTADVIVGGSPGSICTTAGSLGDAAVFKALPSLAS